MYKSCYSNYIYITVSKGVSGNITFTLPDNIAEGYTIIAVLGIQTPQSSIMRIANWMITGRSLQLTSAPPSGRTGAETSIPYYLRFLMYNNAKVEYL